MSTYDDVKTLADLLWPHVTIDAPAVRWAQIGSPIVTCESMAVGVTNVTDQQLFDLLVNGKECQTIEVLEIIALIARECAFEADEDGVTDVPKTVEISERQDTDLTALRAWVKSLTRPPAALTSVAFVREGGIVVTSVTTSVYAGWDTE